MVLAVKLNNIFIDNKKMHANVPRFNSYKGYSKGGGTGVSTRDGYLKMKEVPSRKIGTSNARVGDGSFVEVVSTKRNFPKSFLRKSNVHLKFQFVAP